MDASILPKGSDFVIRPDDMLDFAKQHGWEAMLTAFAEESHKTIGRGGVVQIKDYFGQTTETLKTDEEVDAWVIEMSKAK